MEALLYLPYTWKIKLFSSPILFVLELSRAIASKK